MAFTRTELRLVAFSVVLGLFIAVVVIFSTTEEARVPEPAPKEKVAPWAVGDESPGYLDAKERARMRQIFGP